MLLWPLSRMQTQLLMLSLGGYNLHILLLLLLFRAKEQFTKGPKYP